MGVRRRHTVGKENSIYTDKMGRKRSRRESDFLGIKEDGCHSESHHFGGLGFSELVRSKNMFLLPSEVVSLLTTTQVLQMRGGADTDEKMGHE